MVVCEDHIVILIKIITTRHINQSRNNDFRFSDYFELSERKIILKLIFDSIKNAKRNPFTLQHE